MHNGILNNAAVVLFAKPDIYGYIFKHLSLSGKIEGFEREEQLTVPYKAIREGVINSLCHRC